MLPYNFLVWKKFHTHTHTHTNTHTHTLNGTLSGTTHVSRYQKGKTNLDFTGARDSERQWHQLGHMQVCTSLQTDNHTSTSLISIFTGQMPVLPPNFLVWKKFLTHTHTYLTAHCLGLPRWARTRKVKPIWILLEQETVSGNGISWAICKCAPRSRQITTPAPHYSVFLQARCPSCRPTNSVKALKALWKKFHRSFYHHNQKYI